MDFCVVQQALLKNYDYVNQITIIDFVKLYLIFFAILINYCEIFKYFMILQKRFHKF